MGGPYFEPHPEGIEVDAPAAMHQSVRAGGYVPPPSEREMDMENVLTRIALVAGMVLHKTRGHTAEESSIRRGDALRAIEKLASSLTGVELDVESL